MLMSHMQMLEKRNAQWVIYDICQYPQEAKLKKKVLQVHRHGHTVAVYQQTRWEISAEDFHIVDVRKGVRFVGIGTLHRRRQGGEHHGCFGTVAGHQFVEDQVLRATREVVK